MPAKALDLAEFYQQLALLVKAKLPLPESLAQLGSNVNGRKFRRIVEAVGERTAQGIPLHEAMADQGDTFPEFHVQLIRTGEKTGALPEILFEVAQFSRSNQNMVARSRETMSYPAFTIFVSLLVFVLVLRYVVPGFEEMMAEMLNMSGYYSWYDEARGADVPIYTAFMFSLSHVVNALWSVLLALFAIAAIVLLFLFSGLRTSERILYRLMRVIPGTGRVMREADWARVTGLLAIYLRRKVGMVDALAQTSQLTENRSLSEALNAWAESVGRGASFPELIADDSRAEPLFSLCVQHSPEAKLGDELQELSELYSERAEAARARALAMWQFITVLVMTTTVAWVIISMFQPLRAMLTRVG